MLGGSYKRRRKALTPLEFDALFRAVLRGQSAPDPENRHGLATVDDVATACKWLLQQRRQTQEIILGAALNNKMDLRVYRSGGVAMVPVE